MIATQHSGMLICNENAVKGLVNNRIELIGDRTRWLLKHFLIIVRYSCILVYLYYSMDRSCVYCVLPEEFWGIWAIAWQVTHDG